YAMRHGDNEQSALIRKAIENAERDSIDDIIAIIQSTGAIDYTAQTAREEADAAKTALQILPDSEYKMALMSLADFAVSREF
ncbi:MAG: octaprenyl diphosphate synthase, partial [Methylophaga sp.]|nr:octaprenyl diphosphate synthase [Methylophaga sp.]